MHGVHNSQFRKLFKGKVHINKVIWNHPNNYISNFEYTDRVNQLIRDLYYPSIFTI